MGFGTGQGGSNNTFIGTSAGAVTTGQANVFIGSSAGANNTTGLGNLFMGQQAGATNVGGNYNLFMGNSTGSTNSSGLGNTAIGDGALLKNSAGTHNVAIGRYAGVESRNDENVFIGFAADVTPATPNLTNVMALGARARVSQNNSIVLGDPTNAAVNLGLGTSAPSTKLHVVSSAANTSGLRLQNLTSSSPATVLGSTKFLTVDANGNVVMASLNASPRLATETSDAMGVSESYWTLGNGRLSRAGSEPVVIGNGIAKVSGAYGLYVEKGILTEKVRVAVKNSSEWADYVFAPSYKLRKLEEVEAFIKSHGHLPGVPSAEQVVAEGVDVAGMDAKLLEKVEELTLYMVHMNKKMNALEEENAKLRRKNTAIERQVKQIRRSSK
ncbi:MAG: bZIP transcription factor [Cytophagales bacterium]|nr:MAG: bZIP transcription factor [Cytophagales bacterium]